VTRTEALINKIANLNPDAGEIGPGMLAHIVYEARSIQNMHRRSDEDRVESIRAEELSKFDPKEKQK
jgi:hypothetical protein